MIKLCLENKRLNRIPGIRRLIEEAEQRINTIALTHFASRELLEDEEHDLLESTINIKEVENDIN